MASTGGNRDKTRFGKTLLLGLVCGLTLPGCAWLPSEFNMSPLYRQRLDVDGTVLELDVLWPIIHYETLEEGGTDFRIRPFYRCVTKPDTDGFGEPAPPPPESSAASAAGSERKPQVDHQFLWPLGRVRVREKETHARLWPLWNHDSRKFVSGREETDWYFLFPFFWGGSDREAPDLPAKHYFGMFPLWLDAPGEFLTYDRLTMCLFPLYVRTEKDTRVGHTFLWPLLSFGSGTREDDTTWHRFLPFYSYVAREGQFERRSILWPFINWGRDLLDTDDPLRSFSIWPLFGWQTSRTRNAWSFLWPFFRGQKIQGKRDTLNLFWPFFHSSSDNTTDRNIRSWWLWPFVSHTTARHQDSWSFLWPLIWWRSFDDPDGRQTQRWVLPFYKHVHRDWKDSDARWEPGGEDDYLQIWPLFHLDQRRDGSGEFAFPSPWFYRDGNAEGVDEAYGWAYTLYKSRSRADNDHAAHLTGHLFTTRSRRGRTQTSVPLLFSYESDADASTFYLFNLIPFRFGKDRERP